MPYLVGSRIRLSAQVKTSPGGVPVDPDNLTLQIKNKATNAMVNFVYLVDPGMVKDAGAGAFHRDYTPPSSALYTYRFSCTGTIEDAAEGSFIVSRSHVI